jgi:hypothetical protein
MAITVFIKSAPKTFTKLSNNIQKPFLWEFGPRQLTRFHFILMQQDFISQPSLKSTLPFAGLQHMQQYQVNFQSIFAFML